MPDMRFAPPKALRMSNPAGLNQTNVRSHNERTVLSLLRQHEGLSRVEIVQASGLSSQAVSVIVRALEDDGLCVAGELQKGKVGPPSKPMRINPSGACSIGVQIGRSAADIVFIDFAGEVRHADAIAYPGLDTEQAFGEVASAIRRMREDLSEPLARRIVGIGLAVPADLDELSLPDTAISELNNIESYFAAKTGLDVYVQDDVAAAITGEVLFGAARNLDDFAYLFLGRHPELRLVLNHRIQRRPSALDGSTLPTVTKSVEHSFELTAPVAARDSEKASDHHGTVQKWVTNGAYLIMKKIEALLEFVELEAVVLDGRLPAPVRQQLVDEVCKSLSSSSTNKPALPEIVAGATGVYCKAFGAACLPIYSRFMLEEVSLP